MRRALLILVAPLVVVACGGRAATGAVAAQERIVHDGVTAVIETPPLDQLHWGVLAVDLGTGRVLSSRAAHRKFIPASNMKVLVAAAALDRLGPDHRFRTDVHAAGDLDTSTGVLHGDLVVTATGDPSLSERYWPDDVAPLRALADSLWSAGVVEVRGDLVIDATRWDSTTAVGSWMVDNLPWYYSAPGGAFTVAESEIEVMITGAERPGLPARVTASPLGWPDFVESRVTTVAEEDGSVQVTWLPESRRLRIHGTVPVGASQTRRLANRDPVRQAAALLHRVLGEGGVAVRGGWRVDWGDDEAGSPAGNVLPSASREPAPGRALLASLESPPLMELVEGMLEPSQNWIAEQIVRYLGASDTTRAGWGSGLLAMERTLVEEIGVDSLDLELRDGSGMSAYSLVTPRALVRVLEWARSQPWGEDFAAALAEPGEEDSTLENRLLDLEGRLQAKTGTISNVNSLSGYLVTSDGRTVVFSVLTNGSGLPSSPVREGIDAVVRALAGGAGARPGGG